MIEFFFDVINKGHLMNYKLKYYAVFSLNFSVGSSFINASTMTNNYQFERLFTDWAMAFNERNLSKSCNLFSRKIVADYRGIARKNYRSICNGFKKIFSDSSRQYHYHFKLREIYQSGSLAAVRITWFLKISDKNGAILTTQDEGLDVLEKDKRGNWKIVNYLSYALNEPGV